MTINPPIHIVDEVWDFDINDAPKVEFEKLVTSSELLQKSMGVDK